MISINESGNIHTQKKDLSFLTTKRQLRKHVG